MSNQERKKRVAIYQNTLTGGGRIVVVNEIIRILNHWGIIPDLYALRVNPNIKFKSDLEFQIKKLPECIRGFYELKIPFLNILMHSHQNQYDLLINSNNSMLFAPTTVQSITYMHFPRESRVLTRHASLAFPDGPLVQDKNLGFRLYRRFLIGLYGLRKRMYNHTIITNSEFTKSQFIEAYPESKRQNIEVIYPPIPIDKWKPTSDQHRREETVVTLGRFGADKRQLEQIRIAGQLPDLGFHIIGFVGDRHSRGYFRECQRLIESSRTRNVSLHPNLSYEETKKFLHHSRYYMHNLRNEPFGISTVEAIAAGCIPIVHDSGGPREAVPFPELRFGDSDEAVKRIKQLQKSNVKSLLSNLQNHILLFDTASFINKMSKILNSVLFH
jgi:glycosyltransferase involved in cell wall biosynthesis